MVAFDTLKLSRKLESAGFTHEQATGAAEALADVVSDNVATKADLREEGMALRNDLREMEARTDAKFAAVYGELKLIKWMLAFVIAAVVIPLIRDFM